MVSAGKERHQSYQAEQALLPGSMRDCLVCKGVGTIPQKVFMTLCSTTGHHLALKPPILIDAARDEALCFCGGSGLYKDYCCYQGGKKPKWLVDKITEAIMEGRGGI